MKKIINAMQIIKNFIKILKKYKWLFLITIGILTYFINIEIFKYVMLVIAIIFALIIFWPFIITIFSPTINLISSLIENFKESENISWSNKYIFKPMSLLSITLFFNAQILLFIWVLVLSYVIWTSIVGFYWTFILTFFTLVPIIILTAPFLVWFNQGFPRFIETGIFFLIPLLLSLLQGLSFSETYATPEEFFGYPPSEEFLFGYSPQIFILGALSTQVIALPFYHFNLSLTVGDIISDFGGGIFLILAFISAFKRLSLKKKLSQEEKEQLYKPPFWIYIIGLFFTHLLIVIQEKLSSAILYLYFLVALIVRFLGIFHRRPKIQETKYENEQE